MKNTAADLNNYLFEEIERLQDQEASDEELDRCIQNGALQLKAAQITAQQYGKVMAVPLLGIEAER